MKVTYLSLNSGLKKQEIVPDAVGDNHIRWRVCAFDRLKRRFAGFVITRITDARTLAVSSVDEELQGADAQLNRVIDVELTPHTQLKHPKAISAAYGMVDSALRVQARDAVVAYALLRRKVDRAPDRSLDLNKHHLRLSNTPTLCWGRECGDDKRLQ